MSELKQGDIVKWAQPMPDEENDKFVVLEVLSPNKGDDRPERIKIGEVSSDYIKATWIYESRNFVKA